MMRKNWSAAEEDVGFIGALLVHFNLRLDAEQPVGDCSWGTRTRDRQGAATNSVHPLLQGRGARSAWSSGRSRCRAVSALLDQEHPDSQVRLEKDSKKYLGIFRRRWGELYEYRSARLHGRFRKDLCAFSGRLILADPQERISVAELATELHSKSRMSGMPMTFSIGVSFSVGRAAAFYERGEYELGELFSAYSSTAPIDTQRATIILGSSHSGGASLRRRLATFRKPSSSCESCSSSGSERSSTGTTFDEL